MERERIRTSHRGGRLRWYETRIAERAGELSSRPKELIRNGVIIILTTAGIGLGLGLAAARGSHTPTPLPERTPPATTPDTTTPPNR